jgi:hypothetical protein
MASIAEQQARIAIFQNQMFSFARQADSLFRAVDSAKPEFVIVFDPAGVAKLDALQAQAQASVNAAYNAAYTGVVNGRPATYDDIVSLVRRLNTDLTAYAEWVDKANSSTITARIGSTLGATMAALAALVAGVGAGISNLAKIIPWLPAIAIGIFVVPPVIRLILAGRRGGTDAVLEESATGLERARDSFKSGAKKAALLATKAAI